VTVRKEIATETTPDGKGPATTAANSPAGDHPQRALDKWARQFLAAHPECRRASPWRADWTPGLPVLDPGPVSSGMNRYPDVVVDHSPVSLPTRDTTPRRGIGSPDRVLPTPGDRPVLASERV